MHNTYRDLRNDFTNNCDGFSGRGCGGDVVGNEDSDKVDRLIHVDVICS
jgi:hypothetical protein